MKFTKIHSLGNDFLILDDEETRKVEKAGELAVRI